ncbi:MAG: hypothetical protein AB9834_00255 [Lentimicrobium sp.]
MKDNRLIISTDGAGSEAEWEFLVDNDCLMIKADTLSIYNCHIVFDEFMILNKDNTDDFELFANFSKYKNSSSSDTQNNFKRLFATVEKDRTISSRDKIFIIQLYELRDLLRVGKNKSRIIRLIDNLMENKETGRLFNFYYQSIFGYTFVLELNGSPLNHKDKEDIAQPLLRNKILIRN